MPRARVAAFGAAGGVERGWVAISRKVNKAWEPNFSGFAISEASLPPSGTVLIALTPLPVWREPQAGSNDPDKLAASLSQAACVKVLATRVGAGRLWAEIAPASCS
jgi:hypothetical protein